MRQAEAQGPGGPRRAAGKMRRLPTILSMTLLVTAMGGVAMAVEGVVPAKLMCEYVENPLGVDTVRPRLSWVLASDERGQAQTAYQVWVASSAEKLEAGQADLWDSGKVESDQSIQVVYGGKPLTSGMVCHWKMRVWDKAGRPSAFSEPAAWEMGLLRAEDWTGKWIAAPAGCASPREAGPSKPTLPKSQWIWHPTARGARQTVLFRRLVALPDNARIQEALVQITAIDLYTLSINSQIIGANSTWQELAQYNVAYALRPGKNVIAVEARQLGEEFGLFFGMQVRDETGRMTEVLSDEAWLTSTPPADGWKEQGYDDSNWAKAAPVARDDKDIWGPVPRFSNQYDNLEPAPMFRKTFRMRAGIARARAYICGLGYYELYLNGRKVGDHVLDPGQTNYDKHALYVTYDVTDHLRSGENAAGILLGDGWYNQSVVWGGGMAYGKPAVIVQIRIDYDDGTSETVVTDETWRVSRDGPIRENNVHVGEVYDALREMPRWADAGLDDSQWPAAEVVEPASPRLISQMMPPIKAVKMIKPVRVLNPRPGMYVFDLGRNFAGWCRLHVEAKAGTRITLRFAEHLNQDGFIDTASTGVFATKVVQTDTYICKGEGREVWQPRFTYHGFRYVEMTGFPGVPGVDNLEGVVVHTALEQAGRFECSDPLLNRIHDTALWTQLSNTHSVATDCPARERCGWLGDAHCAAEMTIFNFRMPLFDAKYMRDIETSLGTGGRTYTGRQASPGIPTNIAPGKRTCEEARPDWGSAIMQIPWFLYRYYDDTRVLADHDAHMKDWVAYLGRLAENHIITEGYGDWCAPRASGADATSPARHTPAPVPLTSTAYYYFDVSIMAEACRALGKHDEAKHYAGLAEQIKTAFIEKFFDAPANTFGSQTADSMALYLGLVPAGREQAVAQSLVRNVVETNGGHFTVGIHGVRHLYRQLSRYGHGDVAVKVFRAEGYPGFKYLFSLGATTIWELWGEEAALRPPGYSLNHPMHGGYDPWFYQCLAGIDLAPDAPAFKHIILKPDTNNDIQWAKATHDSLYGPITSEWHRDDKTFRWRVGIPVNTLATVYVPAGDVQSVTENGQPVADVEGVRFLRQEDGRAVLQVGSGTYDFAVR